METARREVEAHAAAMAEEHGVSVPVATENERIDESAKSREEVSEVTLGGDDGTSVATSQGKEMQDDSKKKSSWFRRSKKGGNGPNDGAESVSEENATPQNGEPPEERPEVPPTPQKRSARSSGAKKAKPALAVVPLLVEEVQKAGRADELDESVPEHILNSSVQSLETDNTGKSWKRRTWYGRKKKALFTPTATRLDILTEKEEELFKLAQQRPLTQEEEAQLRETEQAMIDMMDESKKRNEMKDESSRGYSSSWFTSKKKEKDATEGESEGNGQDDKASEPMVDESKKYSSWFGSSKKKAETDKSTDTPAGESEGNTQEGADEEASENQPGQRSRSRTQQARARRAISNRSGAKRSISFGENSVAGSAGLASTRSPSAGPPLARTSTDMSLQQRRNRRRSVQRQTSRDSQPDDDASQWKDEKEELLDRIKTLEKRARSIKLDVGDSEEEED